jgi:hypothetical protein
MHKILFLKSLKIGGMVAAALLIGCAVVTRPLAEWKPMGGPGPWAAPKQRAVLETREYDELGFSRHDERWRAPDGRSADAWKTCERFVDQLTQTGELPRWPETHTYVYKVEGAQRLGPYLIYLVSLFPDVAILVPHDYGPLTNRSIADIVGWGHDALGDPRIMNHIYYGPSVPGAGQVYWVSADLKVPLTPVTMTAGGGFTVAHPKVELVGRPRDGGFDVIRVR